MTSTKVATKVVSTKGGGTGGGVKTQTAEGGGEHAAGERAEHYHADEAEPDGEVAGLIEGEILGQGDGEELVPDGEQAKSARPAFADLRCCPPMIWR